LRWARSWDPSRVVAPAPRGIRTQAPRPSRGMSSSHRGGKAQRAQTGETRCRERAFALPLLQLLRSDRHLHQCVTLDGGKDLRSILRNQDNLFNAEDSETIRVVEP